MADHGGARLARRDQRGAEGLGLHLLQPAVARASLITPARTGVSFRASPARPGPRPRGGSRPAGCPRRRGGCRC